MELRQLEAFVEVARSGNFSRAADSLFLTQPSLSARIHALEREVDDTLFHRMGRGVRLTDAGKTLLPYAERALEILRTGKEALESARTISSGKLHLGSGRVISTYVLPEIVEAFHHRYPGIDITIKTGRSTEVLEMVRTEDVQIGLARTLVHPEIESEHLYDEEIVLVTHPDHPFARRGTADIHDIGREPLIQYHKGSAYFVMIEEVCRASGIAPHVVMNLDSIEATKRMIELGLGVSFLPVHSLRRELELGTLARIELAEGYQINMPISVIVRRAKHYAPGIVAFLELLKSIFRAPMSFLDGHRSGEPKEWETDRIEVPR